jgi:hypothetical protein
MGKDPKLQQLGGFITMMQSITSLSAYGPLLLLVYPVALLLVMFLPTVRDAFRAAASPVAEDEEEYDDEEYEDGEEEARPGPPPTAGPEDGIQPGEE